MGRSGDGQVVSAFAFYSDDQSSNSAEVFNFERKLTKASPGMAQFLKIIL